MKKFSIMAVAVLSIASIASAEYTYENAEDWIKLGGGALAGIFTASFIETSDNLCFKNALSVADSAIDYSLTGLKEKTDTMDWLIWGGASVGGVALIAAKALYYCLGTDPNFGWITPTDYADVDLETVILSPWTQDFILSLFSVVSGVRAAFTQWQTLDPYFLSKKVAQGTWGSFLKFI